MSEVTGVRIIGVEREAITKLHQLIMDILHSNVENETKRTALEVVGELAKVENVYIEDNTFNLIPEKDTTNE